MKIRTVNKVIEVNDLYLILKLNFVKKMTGWRGFMRPYRKKTDKHGYQYPLG
jgi:hypothetical protein